MLAINDQTDLMIHSLKAFTELINKLLGFLYNNWEFQDGVRNDPSPYSRVSHHQQYWHLGWGILCGGELSCALWHMWYQPWPLPTRWQCQPRRQTPPG